MPSPTDTKVRTAKPTEKPCVLQDGSGLYLEVRPTGAKFWRYRYWLTPEKDGRYIIGEYPSISLSDARRERERMRELVKQGIHPTQEKQTEKLRQSHERANTFEAIAREWLEWKKGKWSTYSHKQATNCIEQNAFPKIGKLPLRKVTAAHLLHILQAMEERGAETYAMQLRQWCSAIFRHAVVATNFLSGRKNSVARRMSFYAVRCSTRATAIRKKRRYLLQETLAIIGKGRITYTGEELRQDDATVWLQLIQMASDTKLGAVVEFTPYSFCQSVGWTPSGETYAHL